MPSAPQAPAAPPLVTAQPPVAAAPQMAAPAVAAAPAPVPPAASAPTPGPAPAAALSASDSSRDLPQTFFLGRYRVVDEIGVGGMASVHLARVDGPGGFQKWVAIKRIHPHLVEDDQFVDMFLDEARIAAGINHANVAQVFDLGKDENTYWIAMEYLHGEPLREIMRRVEDKNGRIPFHIAARICADAAEGLHGAHELRGRAGQLLNLVHRDVTPHNLFITYEGYTKVVDFGIAKVVDRLASTRAGTLKGKLAYMSPEQVRGQEVDRKTDIFALGVVLWELTTNRRLFRMETDLDTLEKVQACVVPLPSTLVPEYPSELEQVVMKALSQRKEDRFATARELSRSLQRYLMSQGTFVGPEDVGDYIKGLFTDRVRTRERYLEWAAEVTSAVDVDQLRAQQANGEQQAPSLLHAAPIRGSAPAAPESQAQVPGQGPTDTHMSGGRANVAASLVTSAPAPQAELAASSLMDEDEDIPTVVAQPREPEPSQRGPRPAAGAPAQSWDGAATQIVPDEDGLEATIALPGDKVAGEIRAQVEQMERQRAQQMQPTAIVPTPLAPAGMQPGAGSPQQIAAPGDPARAVPGQQGAIETKMSMPRPAAIAQWLLEQGDVEIQGPRSTGVIIAIAALATLCVMGVASLIVYKLRLPPQTTNTIGGPVAAAGPSLPQQGGSDQTATGAAPTGSKREPSGSSSSRSRSGGKHSSRRTSSGGSAAAKTAKAKSREPPGRLTITCKPPCDQVIVDSTSLGPSPVFSHPIAPGQHRVTLKRRSKSGKRRSKTIVVPIKSNELTSKTVKMK